MASTFPSIDFRDYHCTELPELLKDGRGADAARSAKPLGSLAFQISETGDAYRYEVRSEAHGDEIAIVPGADARTVVELKHSFWEGLVHDLESAPGLLYGNFAKNLRGDMMDFVGWEPALRAMYRGRPVYDPDRLTLLGRSGEALDPSQCFTLEDDDDDEMAHFLATTGYLLIRGVFDSDEVAAMNQDAELLRAGAVEGSPMSWWGKDAQGEPLLCRVLNAADRPLLAALYDDPRIVRMSRLPRQKLVARSRVGNNTVTVLWKQPGVVEGLGDLPWHRDCGMGGHSAMCPAVNCSLFLGPATPAAGDLRFLPGSWQASVGFADGDDSSVARGISLNAKAGDVSLHYGDVVHAAPPPASTTGPFRTSVLLGWGQPDAKHHRGEAHYNDALFQDGNTVPDLREKAEQA